MLAVSMPTALIERFAINQRAASGCKPGKCSFAAPASPRSGVPRYRAGSGHRR